MISVDVRWKLDNSSCYISTHNIALHEQIHLKIGKQIEKTKKKYKEITDKRHSYLLFFMSTAVGVHVLPECATKGSVYWRTGGDHKITLLDGLNSILLYKLECFLGISTTERNRITTLSRV